MSDAVADARKAPLLGQDAVTEAVRVILERCAHIVARTFLLVGAPLFRIDSGRECA